MEESDGEVTEFTFGVEPEAGDGETVEYGLVFDDSGEEDEPEPKPAAPKISFETVEKPEEHPVEISVPDKFVVNEKYDTKLSAEEAPRIITTYVPTFTGAGDNYRMKDDPRPRIQTKPTVSTDEATKEFAEDLDPTAEIDESVQVEAATPITGAKEPENDESVSKVFKFTENEEATAPAPMPEEPEAPAPEVETAASEPEITEELLVEEGEYKMPDPEIAATPPVERTVSASLAERMVLIDAPADVGGAPEHIRPGKGSEYTSYAQRDSFKDKYLDKIMSVRVRFFACAAITLVLLIVELIYAAGVNIPKLLNLETVLGAMALIDVQFVACLFLISLPETVGAVRLLLKKQVTPALYLPLAFIAIIAYTAAAVTASPPSYPLFGVLYAVSVLTAIGGTHYKLSADFTAFKLVSENGEKKIIDTRYTRTLEYENSALDGAVEEHKSKIARMFRTVFVSDFFARAEICAESSFNNLLTLGVSFGLGLVTGGISWLLSGAMSGFSAFAMVFLTAFPVFALTAQKQPYYHAAAEARAESSAVIGEAALLDYAETDVITFEDTEVFGAEDVTLQRIMLYGQSENLSKALRQMSALFIKVGGPLDLLFSNSLDRKCAPANCVEVFADGVTGEIDGVSVSGGNLKFMRERGIFIPDDGDRPEPLSESTRVMYAAEGDKVYAKFYIRYSFSEEFSMLLPLLDDEKIKVLIYTRDPGINRELMKTLTAGADKLRVIRRNTPHSHDNPLYNQVSIGAVTLGDKANAINTILIAKKYEGLESRLIVSERIALAVGGALAFVLSLGGMFVVPPLALAIWQAGWCGALHIISRRSFPLGKDKGI